MDRQRLETVLDYLRTRVAQAGAQSVSDGQLLERFVGRRDEAAFELLVRRHGPLVWELVRRLLGNTHDAEDAFQATFLVLVRRASSLHRRGSLAGWLYGVAHRIGIRARANTVRRREREKAAGATRPVPVDSGSDTRELREMLDEEMNRLPEKYRTPLVLCYLEGKTHEQAAQQLSWPLGTLKCRVARGRERLRRRLARRGLALSAALVTAGVAAETAPAALMDAAARIAVQSFTGKETAGLLSARAIAWAEGALQAMTLTRIKSVVVVLLVAATLGGGATLMAPRAQPPQTLNAAEPAVARSQEKASQPARPKAAVNPALEALWADLAGTDQMKVMRAVLALGATPKETLPFLKERLKPVLADPERMARWLLDLDSDRFAVREQAEREIEYAGELALPYLRRALAGKPSLEVRKRIERLLEQVKPGVQPAGWVRAGRAIALLEHFGHAASRQLLQVVARGRTKAPPTQQAEAALDRLGESRKATRQTQWDHLRSADEGEFLRALLALAAVPKESLPFLREQVQAIKKEQVEAIKQWRAALVKGRRAPTAQELLRIEQLILELIRTQGGSWRAEAELEKFGMLAEPALRKALEQHTPKVNDTVTDLMLRPDSTKLLQRIRRLLEKIEVQKMLQMPQQPDVVRVVAVIRPRLTVLLEHIGTAEAREILALFPREQDVLDMLPTKEELAPWQPSKIPHLPGTNSNRDPLGRRDFGR